MSLDQETSKALFSALKSTGQRLSVFQGVNTHEPWNSPGKGLYLSYILATLVPGGARSGLNSTSGTITFTARLWSHSVQLPADETDPQLLAAAAALMAALSLDLDFGDFPQLDGVVRNIDLMSMTGQTGWVPFQDASYRVFDVRVPVVINDMFQQSAGGGG